MGRSKDYGKGHPEFIEYVNMIVNHRNYQGMPDAFRADGGVQWEAPSNRPNGRFKETHNKRRDWWRARAKAIGIDVNGPLWISTTAKRIHPTGEKPCKNCGTSMLLSYTYPNRFLFKRITLLPYFDKSFELSRTEDVTSLFSRMFTAFGSTVLIDAPLLLRSAKVCVPSSFESLDALTLWLFTVYIPSEPPTLSPGAMSNAPDRFDGFHSFNLCCRSKEDTGRLATNLKSYTTDRRVFEYWVDGNWVAADRLMGIIRSASNIQQMNCYNAHPGPCAADHIGPISLGFSHRPEFRLLCNSCNSAKNNRMTYNDVKHLISAEEAGENVASWYMVDLWDSLKGRVANDEQALRLSKLLRDNRHNIMHLLHGILGCGYLHFLLQFLHLHYADFNYGFEQLKIVNSTTHFSGLIKTERQTTYASEQKSRRIRIAFEALNIYISKDNRNRYTLWDEKCESKFLELKKILDARNSCVLQFDSQLCAVLSEITPSEQGLRLMASTSHMDLDRECYDKALATARSIAQHICNLLVEKWDDERYVRSEGCYDL